MNLGKSARGTLAAVILLFPPAGLSEITDIRGSVEALIQEVRFNVDGDRDDVFELFPETAGALPIRVVASLDATGSEVAAARAAAQLADPSDLNQPNPQEFAINLALNSLTPNTAYRARVRSEEVREIVFRPGELGEAVEGQTVLVFGRLFIDGALAIFSSDPIRDLMGANVSLAVRVVQETDAGNITVFAGTVEINGALAGEASVSASGQIDTQTLILSDLAPVSDEFAVFRVLIIPNLDIVYSYEAGIEEPFRLRASVEISASNLGREVGVAALVGAPTDSLEQVIGATTGQAAAGKMLAAIERERSNPTGAAAFPPPAAPPTLCGLFGLELIVGLTLMGALRFVARRRR